jgi:hypothetical protein
MSIPNSNLSVISGTCTLFSVYNILRDSNETEFSQLTLLLHSTLTHGCFHLRDLLRRETSEPTEASGEEPATISCSELQFLDTLCSSASEVIKQSIVEIAGKILNTYRRDENLDRCKWLHSNMATQFIKNLFHC